VIALLIGAAMIWMPERYAWTGFTRLVQFLIIVLILQLVLLHIRLYSKAFQRYVTAFTQTVAIVTIALVVALAALLIVPLVAGEWVRFAELYWRIVVAVAILAAVGTALIPLVNALFAPKKPRPVAEQPAPYGGVPAVYPQPSVAQSAPTPVAQLETQQELLPWPTFVDGITPLPMMPDGQPDWGAYYTGYPSEGAHVFTHAAPAEPAPSTDAAPAADAPPAPAGSGYEGYPPPPPLPPRP
jgi:hypothetical protein